MKTRILIWYTFLAVGCLIGKAQDPTVRVLPAPTAQSEGKKAKGPVFDVEFSGGTPAQLVKAIQKQSPRPVNVVIPSDSDSVVIPAFSMRAITVDQLFEALSAGSLHSITILSGRGPDGRQFKQTMQVSYGFRTVEKDGSDNTVWYFYNSEPKPEETNVNQLRYFNLSKYLESYSVEDITTAIQTGWKMLHLNPQPTLSFHKETGLLIAVGAPEQLVSINETLNELERGLMEKGLHKPKTEEKANEQLKK